MNILIYDHSHDVRKTISDKVNRLGSSVKIVSVDSIPLTRFNLLKNAFDLAIINVDNLSGSFQEIVHHVKTGSPQASVILFSMNRRVITEEIFKLRGVDHYFNGLPRLDEFIDTIQDVAERFLSESHSYNKYSRVN